MQALLFGPQHERATLGELSWRLASRCAIILDDTVFVWDAREQQLLIPVKRAATLRDLPSLNGIEYLALLADRRNGGDCSMTENGIQTDAKSQLFEGTEQLLCMLEMRRNLLPPDDLTILRRFAQFQWSKLHYYQQKWWRDQQQLFSQLRAKDKKIAELQAELTQAGVPPQKRHKPLQNEASNKNAG